MATTKTIDNLPCEILIAIFNCLDSFAEMQICSHVNKQWRELCLPVMCNRNLTIATDQEATLFYWWLYFNKDKRHLIKHVTFIDTTEDFECLEHTPDLLTDSLETMDGKVHNFMFYIGFPVPEIVATVYSKIKTIPDAGGYSTVYNDILYNLRHSLEKVVMGFPASFDTSYSNKGALGHLDEFKKLKSLRFNSYFHNIAQTEAIIKNCDMLHDLTIHLSLINGTGVPGNFDTWLKKNVQQIQSLKTLKIIISQKYHPSLTKYLFYKYPNVETVIVEKFSTDNDWTTDHVLNILQDIKVKPRFILECGVDDEGIYTIIDDLLEENYIASEDILHILEPEGSLLRVQSDPAMENVIPSLIKRPASLRVRYPTREEILAAQQDSDLSSTESSSE